ncbi:hypothetical protein L798_05797 [Zootermopsis nevadensis]|uniref:Bis(5'-nucleosyl)-tetraphosphatase [asymmetrical] n=2 Tax=Zootermopsis nevadensis TaxID=136037 RepID=A0A067RI00_ZOONE|nr:Bis(5'-nucleosyl)-tetraphosphatase [asymmetrical] [Zootermopsis nevadensis]KDR23435.1 hypothetical protein L798_05797 [Zootermopsis nevadensis]
MSSSANELRASGFVIFRMVCNQIEYLLLQTSYGKHHWTPPKGHVDPGESDLETALRETEEESGLRKMDLHIIEDFNKTIKYNVRGTPKTAVYLLAELIRLDTPVKLSDEHQDFKWVPLDKACKLVEHQTLQEVLKECSTFLQQNRI